MRGKFVLLLSLFLLPLPVGAEAPLTNEDVVKMVSAGLGEDLVIAKVQGTQEVSFALDVEDLVSLKSAGVSDRVVQAMLLRSARPAPVPPPNPWMGTGLAPVEVALETGERSVPLSFLRGEITSPGFAGFGTTYANYPGLRADVRTKDRRPTLLVKSTTPLSTGGFFLGKLDQDEDDGVRSLKIAAMKSGMKAVFGRGSQKIEPDADWTVPFEVVEESPGLWRVSLKQDLEPGEYGWYVALTSGGQGASLYGFGVD